LAPEDSLHIEPVLVKYAHVFHDEEANDFKGTPIIEHEIQVGDAQPINGPLQNAVCTSRRDGTTSAGYALKRALFEKVTHRGQREQS